MMQAATAAVDLALPMLHPADAVLRNFFSANRELGQRDRAFIAETVFSVLRHKRLLEQLVPEPTPRKLVYAALIKVQGYGLGQLESFLKGSDRDWAIALKAADIEAFPAAVKLSLPDWLYDRLVAETSEQEATDFGRAMLKTAPLDLRVNTLLADREQVLRDLRNSGFDATPTRYSPVGIRVAGKPEPRLVERRLGDRRGHDRADDVGERQADRRLDPADDRRAGGRGGLARHHRRAQRDVDHRKGGREEPRALGGRRDTADDGCACG